MSCCSPTIATSPTPHGARIVRGVAALFIPLPIGAWPHDRRFSFCCAIDGRRSRVTPPSLRFLGPKVYIAAIVVLIAIPQHGGTPRRLRELTEVTGVGRRIGVLFAVVLGWHSVDTWRLHRMRAQLNANARDMFDHARADLDQAFPDRRELSRRKRARLRDRGTHAMHQLERGGVEGDRTEPLLPMRPGQAERRTHDYKRHGPR
jgi:hypothetical protein